MQPTLECFLSSSEGYDLEEPRHCTGLKRVRLQDRDSALLARIEPTLIGQPFGLGDRDIDLVILAPRDIADSLFPIRTWPVFVYVARPLILEPLMCDVFHKSEFEVIAWAALYRTENDARAKRM